VHETVFHILATFALLIITAVATHLVMSFAQTLMHYKLGHHPIGGKFFSNHINFHHVYYSNDHLVSRTYLGDEGNNTPFFFIPVFLMGVCTYLVLPLNLFLRTFSSTRNITCKGPGFSALHGSETSRSCTSFITVMRAAILR
jgi:hypothetical protein